MNNSEDIFDAIYAINTYIVYMRVLLNDMQLSAHEAAEYTRLENRLLYLRSQLYYTILKEPIEPIDRYLIPKSVIFNEPITLRH